MLYSFSVGSLRCKEKRRLHITNNVSVKGNFKARPSQNDHVKKQTIHGQTHPKKKPLNEEKSFLRGFLNDVKELGGSDEDDQKTFELSRTLHSDTFYKALDEKKIKITYHPKKEKEAKKKKTKHPVKLVLKSPNKVSAQTKTTSIKPVNNNNVISTTANKQTNSTQHSDRISRKQAIEKELHFLEYLNHKSPKVKNVEPDKRENITVHNSVQSSAKIDGVKLGKRFDIPLVATKVSKRENITVHNSVKSTAKLDGVSLGKRQNILKSKVQEPIYSKRENISIHNSVQSSAKLDTVPLSVLGPQKRLLKAASVPNKNDKEVYQPKSTMNSSSKADGVDHIQKSVIPLNQPNSFSEKPTIVSSNAKRENITVHNSVQSSAKLDGVKLGKRFKIPNINAQNSKHGNIVTHKIDVSNLHQRSKVPQIVLKRENITVHNSVKSTAKLDGVSLGKRQNIAQAFNKGENVTIHNSVKSTGNLDGLSIGKRQKVYKAEKSQTPFQNQVKSSSVLVSQKRDKLPETHSVSSKTVSEANKLNTSMKKSTTTSNEMPDLSSKTESVQKQPNLQEEMEMFNKITETPFDQMELNENMGSTVIQAKMPELKSKKKDTMAKEHLAKKSKSEVRTPTLKSFIGPIGATSRMVGSAKKPNHNQTQTSLYQKRTIATGRVPIVARSGNRNTSMTTSPMVSRKSKVASGQRKRNAVVSSSKEAERPLNTGLSRSRQRRQIKLQGQNTRQITSESIFQHPFEKSCQ